MAAADNARIRAAVFDLALGDAPAAARATTALANGNSNDWDIAISLAAAWGVLAPVRRHLDESRLPPSALAALRQTSFALAARSTFILHRSMRAARLLDAAKIPYVAIKGVGLIAALDRPPATRATGDFDIVVCERDAAAARRAFMDEGFEDISPEFDQHMSDITLSSQLHNYARTLRRDDFEIDLHWRMGPNPPSVLAPERLIDRAAAARAAGATVVVADAVDGVLINVHHALRGSFDLHNTVRDLGDLRLWWDHGPIERRLDETIQCAIGGDLGAPLLALWQMIVARDPAHGLRSGAHRLRAVLAPAECAEADLMQRYIEDQLRHGSAAKFTFELFNPKLYLRGAIGKLTQRAGRRGRPVDAPAGGYRETPRPLPVRIAALPPRVLRVLREVVRTGAVPAYRAVARAQRRFH